MMLKIECKGIRNFRIFCGEICNIFVKALATCVKLPEKLFDARRFDTHVSNLDHVETELRGKR